MALVKELNNPVADLIIFPVQFIYDQSIGPNNGERLTNNLQPVIPFELSEDYNIISRTVLPLITQKDVTAKGTSESGMGDIIQSLFISPKKPINGWIVGAGPVFLLPTATNDALGLKKWGAGPTAVGLRQDGHGLMGCL